MPPYRHSQRGWLTGDSLAPETGRVLVIPGDLAFIMAVNGALTELQYEYNWEQFGTVTPEEAADAMRVMLADYFQSSFVPPLVEGQMSRVDLWYRYATPATVVTSGVTFTINAGQMFAHYCQPISPAQNWFWYHPVTLQPGTYEFRMLYVKQLDSGILTLQYELADGTITAFGAGVDFHAGFALNQEYSTTVTIPDNVVKIRFGTTTKNTGSSGYNLAITAMFLWRTG